MSRKTKAEELGNSLTLATSASLLKKEEQHLKDNFVPQSRLQAEAKRERFFKIIDDALDVVGTQIANYKRMSEEEDMVMPVKDVKALTAIASTLYNVVTAQDLEIKKTVIRDKAKTLRSVEDIAELLRAADPDIDYSNVVDITKPNGTTEDLF